MKYVKLILNLQKIPVYFLLNKDGCGMKTLVLSWEKQKSECIPNNLEIV